MLTLLEITPERPRRFFARMLGKAIPPRVDSYMRGVGRASYLRVFAERRGDKLDWRMVAGYCLDPAMRIVLPRGETIPDGIPMRRFVPTGFLRRLRENYALTALSGSSLPPSGRSVAVCGQEAEIEQLLPRLVPLAGEVRIITRRAYAIRAAAEQISEQTGLAITVTERQDASGCNVLLAPSGGAAGICVKGVGLVVSPDKPSPNNSFPGTGVWAHTMNLSLSNASLSTESAPDASLGDILGSEYGEEYDLLEFAGGLYEIAGLLEFGRIIPDSALTTMGVKRADEIILNS